MKLKSQYWFLNVPWENFHLYKPEVQIPLLIQKKYNTKTYLCFVGQTYKDEIIPKTRNGMEIIIFNNYFQMLIFLIKNVFKIDFLGVFHIIKPIFLLIFCYKLIRFNKGYVYLRGDASYEGLENLIILNKKFPLKALFNMINLISIESKKYYDKIIKNLDYLKGKIYISSNGINFHNIPELEISKKENNIVLINRIGLEKKRVDLFLKIASEIKTKNSWNIYLVGKTRNNFEEQNKNLVEKIKQNGFNVIYTGPIYDKTELYTLLNKCKIFCHIASEEGSALIQYEAMHYGLYGIFTDCGTFKQDYYKKFSDILGIDDINGYKEKLINALEKFDGDNIKSFENLIKKTHEHSLNYSWENLTKFLFDDLEQNFD